MSHKDLMRLLAEKVPEAFTSHKKQPQASASLNAAFDANSLISGRYPFQNSSSPSNSTPTLKIAYLYQPDDVLEAVLRLFGFNEICFINDPFHEPSPKRWIVNINNSAQLMSCFINVLKEENRSRDSSLLINDVVIQKIFNTLEVWTKKGNKITSLIKKCSEVATKTYTRNHYEPENQSLLHIASTYGLSYLAKSILMEPDADVNATDKDGDTPLHLAALNGHSDTINVLVKDCAKINSKNKDERTPLHYAAASGHTDAIRKLSVTPDYIKDNDDPSQYYENAKDKDGRTPLHYAAASGRTDAIRELIESGADVHATDTDGTTPLHYAVESGRTDAIRELIESGADVHATDTDGRTPLHYAAQYGHTDAIKELKALGADVHATDKYGLTPIHLAARSSLDHHDHLLEDILELLNPLDLVYDHILKGLSQEGRTELYKAKNDFGVGLDINAKDENGASALHYAASSENFRPQSISTFISMGADPNAKDNKDATPLHYAARYGSPRTMQLLETFGAQTNAKDMMGETPCCYLKKQKSKTSDAKEKIGFAAKTNANSKNQLEKVSYHKVWTVASKDITVKEYDSIYHMARTDHCRFNDNETELVSIESKELKTITADDSKTDDSKTDNVIFELVADKVSQLYSLTYCKDQNKRLIPVFDKDQTLLEIKGGTVEKDSLGRWILTVKDKKNLRLKLQFNKKDALNKQRNKIINYINYINYNQTLENDTDFNLSDEQLQIITNYFEQSKSKHDRKNTSCAIRAKDFIKLHDKFSYGRNGSDHAYASINGYAIDLGGISEKIFEKEETPAAVVAAEEEEKEATPANAVAAEKEEKEATPANAVAAEKEEKEATPAGAVAAEEEEKAEIAPRKPDNPGATEAEAEAESKRINASTKISSVFRMHLGKNLRNELEIRNVLSGREEVINIDYFTKETMPNQNHLIISDDTETTINELVEVTQDEDSIYCIDGIEDTIPGFQICIKEDGPGKPEQQGRLQKFLAENHEKQKTLIINWENFTEKEIIKHNTMLDSENPTLNGLAIPEKIRIISVIETGSSLLDSSSKSRQPKTFSYKNRTNKQTEEEHDSSNKIIDLKGLSDWKSALFGRLQLSKQTFEWKKQADNIEILTNQGVKITNHPKEHEEEIQRYINRSIALGYFEYHDRKFPITDTDTPPKINLEQQESYDFSNFEQSVSFSRENVNTGKNIPLINSQTFDKLLYGKQLHKIGDTDEYFEYEETKGLIEDAEVSTLDLHITSDLTETQWYCLFTKAKEHNVILNLDVPHGVEPPTENFIVNNKNMCAVTEMLTDIANRPHSYQNHFSSKFWGNRFSCFFFLFCVKNDVKGDRVKCFTEEKETSDLKTNTEKTLQGLRNYLMSNEGRGINLSEILDFINTNYIPSNILGIESRWIKELKEKITDKISENNENNEINEINENNKNNKNNKNILTLHVEDYTASDFLYGLKYNPDEDKTLKPFKFSFEQSDILKKLKSNTDIILTGDFSEQLLYELEEIVSKQEITLPTTETIKFTGKLRLKINKINGETLDSNHELYKRYDNVKYVTLNNEEQKILEQNEEHEEDISSERFIHARLETLKEKIGKYNLLKITGETGVGKSSTIKKLAEQSSNLDITFGLENFVGWAEKGAEGEDKILFIDEVNIKDMHFTMFAPMIENTTPTLLYKNKLYDITNKHKVIFASNPESYGGGRFKPSLFDKIPGIMYVDFPASYIKENILQPIIPVNTPETLDDKMLDNKINKLIKEYLQENKEQRGSITVRELQQALLEYIDIKEKNLDSSDEEKWDEELEASDCKFKSQSESRQKIENFIIIQKYKKDNITQDRVAVGLNGLYIEGEPGVGKSKIIRSILLNNLGEDGYIKIEASSNLQDKKTKIIEAFHQGKAVWIDELNSCIDDGLEEILNSVLTGTDLEGNTAKAPGFMLLATGNCCSSLPGRSRLSPAMLHRLKQIDLETPSSRELKYYTKHLIAKKNIDEKYTQMIIDNLFANNSGNLNLRDIDSKLSTLGENSKFLSSTNVHTSGFIGL